MIYLCVKVHMVTGLRYLCQTSRDPFKYRGSGKDWITHLRQYGNKQHTEVIRECGSNSELNYWGRYYSRLWNVVGAMDDYGNKIWANRIPETGGGCSTGRIFTEEMKIKANQTKMRNGTTQDSENVISKSRITREKNGTGHKSEEVVKKVRDTRKKNGITTTPEMVKKQLETKRKNKSITTGKDHPRYDPIIYTFYHKDGRIEKCTSRELRDKYQVGDYILSVVNGKAKSYKGWRITPEIAEHGLKNLPKSESHKASLRKAKQKDK